MSEEKKDIAETILKWVGVAAAIGGLGIGAFFLEARHSVQVDEIKELIVSENEKHSKQIEKNVTSNIKGYLRAYKDSISTDHKTLMESNYKKDSLLLMVIPRMLDQVRESTTAVKRIESKIQSVESNSTDPIWAYLLEKEKQDSIQNRDAAIMRELRSINKQLLLNPKFGERAK